MPLARSRIRRRVDRSGFYVLENASSLVLLWYSPIYSSRHHPPPLWCLTTTKVGSGPPLAGRESRLPLSLRHVLRAGITVSNAPGHERCVQHRFCVAHAHSLAILCLCIAFLVPASCIGRWRRHSRAGRGTDSRCPLVFSVISARPASFSSPCQRRFSCDLRGFACLVGRGRLVGHRCFVGHRVSRLVGCLVVVGSILDSPRCRRMRRPSFHGGHMSRR